MPRIGPAGQPARRPAGREEIARPLGAEFEIGLRPEFDARVAPLLQGPVHLGPDGRPAFDLERVVSADPEGLVARVFMNPPILDAELVNSREWRAAEIPAANGHTNAHSLARIYACL